MSTRSATRAIATTDKNNNEQPSRKRERESFFGRVSRQTTETAGLAALLVRDPKAFPAAALGLVKRGFRTVWDARGGGLYACGFFVVFVWLEIRTLAGEVFGAESVSGFVTGQVFEFIIRFSVQSIENTVQAFLWPVVVIQWSPPWGFAVLGGMYLVFANFVKAPLEAWLFDDEAGQEEGRGND